MFIMNSASIFIKTDPKLKEEAQETAEELGFSLSSLINAFLRQLVKTKTIQFSAKELEEEPSEYLLREMKQAREDRKEGKASPVFKSADEMIRWIEKQNV